MKCKHCGKELSPRVCRVHEKKCKDLIKRTEKDKKYKLTIDDLKKKDGGWYEFPDGQSVRGKEKAKKKLADINE